jgi:hypothetical protein
VSTENVYKVRIAELKRVLSKLSEIYTQTNRQPGAFLCKEILNDLDKEDLISKTKCKLNSILLIRWLTGEENAAMAAMREQLEADYAILNSLSSES